MFGPGRLNPWVLALAMLAVGCGPSEEWFRHHGGGHGGGGGSSGSSSSSGSGSSSGVWGGSSSSSSGGVTGGSSSSSSSGGMTGGSSSSSGAGETDHVPPVTTASVADGWFVGSVDVTLTCTDAESGCAGTAYTFWTQLGAYGGETADYTGPIHLTEPSYLVFHSIDAAGNHESSHSLNVDVLPEGTSPHLRIGRGSFSVTSPGTGLSGPGRLLLSERDYISSAYWIGLAMLASMHAGQQTVVAVRGSPLEVFFPPEDFEASGLPVAVDGGGTLGASVQLFVAPGQGAEAFPLRLSAPGPVADVPPAPMNLGPATLDIPDAPVLLDFERAGDVLRFTGSLLRGSAGQLAGLTVRTTDGTVECVIPVGAWDEAQVRMLPGADLWHDVVEFTPAATDGCWAPPYALSSIRLEWNVVTEWFEPNPRASPYDRSTPDWSVTVNFAGP